MKDKIKTYTSLPSERLVQNPAFRQAFTHTGGASELIILAIVKNIYVIWILSFWTRSTIGAVSLLVVKTEAGTFEELERNYTFQKAPILPQAQHMKVKRLFGFIVPDGEISRGNKLVDFIS